MLIGMHDVESLLQITRTLARIRKENIEVSKNDFNLVRLKLRKN